ncbi:MAG TPA: 4Fe-4S binding protein [Dongiaceae bacterium]|nr:4Fe-4S binding protein [Dongiaceae bacterium]
MNVVTLLLENLKHGSSTFRFPDSPPTCARFRGLVEYDPEKCDGCGMCSFACTSGAIKGRAGKDKNGKEIYAWSYDPGQCTFCGRCVEVCAPHNLHMQESRPPIYTVSGALKISYTIARRPPGQPQPAANTATASGVNDAQTGGVQ